MAFTIIKNRKLLQNFRDIMALESKYGAKPSFHFQALDQRNLDFNYGIEDLKSELGNIIDKGWEVGLHGGHEAYNDLDETRERKRDWKQFWVAK
jgi:hypothetical protein